MKSLLNFVLVVSLFNFLIGCNGQQKPTRQKQNTAKGIVGGGCEGCELMYVNMPKRISSEHASIGWEKGKQKLILRGKVFQLDGKTPATDVMIYYWHTDDNGLYSSDNQTWRAVSDHGRLRGWVKSGKDGNYTIKTSRPAAYPNDSIPQHIHLSIKEPRLNNEYFADRYFADDPLYLKHKKKYGVLDRAGTELLSVVLTNKVQIAEHNILLGLNIPDYPTK